MVKGYAFEIEFSKYDGGDYLKVAGCYFRIKDAFKRAIDIHVERCDLCKQAAVSCQPNLLGANWSHRSHLPSRDLNTLGV